MDSDAVRSFLIGSKNEEVCRILKTTISSFYENPSFLVANNSNDLFFKASNQEFDFVFIDYNNCKANNQTLKVLSELEKSTIILMAQNHGDIPYKFMDSYQIQYRSLNPAQLKKDVEYVLSNIDEKRMDNALMEIKLREGEVLLHAGSLDQSIYLITEGDLMRVLPDGSVIDELISAGQIIGELTYFIKRPRLWDVVAKTDCKLVRISHSKVDNIFSDHPPWVQKIFQSLADRAIKYSKVS